MKMKTDLQRCKEIAIDFLHLDAEPTEIPLIVSHPFFDSPFCSVKREIVNIFESKENLKKVMDFYEEKILNGCNCISDIFYMMRAPYRMTYFKYIKEYLDEKDFAEMLNFSWLNDENANNNINVSNKELLSHFKKANKEYLMNEDDFKVFESLPNVVTIYRGVTDKNKDNKKALSWTLSQDKAEWFAHRFDEVGKVWKSEISKDNIFAYFDEMDEKEVIIDYNAIDDIETI